MNASGPLDDLIHAETCTGLAIGTMAPTLCQWNHNHGFFPVAWFKAQWPSAAARSAAGSNDGCSFMCAATTCFVRATDGLPVELVGFGVE
jgi:hypothetical protein